VPHQGEVVGVVTLTGKWPGDSAMRAQSESRCTKLAKSYSPSHVDESTLNSFWLRPTQESWNHGDRTLVCFLKSSKQRTGSLAG
jgi:hypothetical protein